MTGSVIGGANPVAFPDETQFKIKESDPGVFSFRDSKGNLRTFRITRLRMEDPKNRSSDVETWKDVDLNDPRAKARIAQTAADIIAYLNQNGSTPIGKSFSLNFKRSNVQTGHLWWKKHVWTYEDLKFKTKTDGGKEVKISVNIEDYQETMERTHGQRLSFTEAVNSTILQTQPALSGRARRQAIPFANSEIIEGTRSQFIGRHRNACTGIATTFLQDTLNQQGDGSPGWIDSIVDRGKQLYSTAVGQLRRPHRGNPLLSYDEIDAADPQNIQRYQVTTSAAANEGHFRATLAEMSQIQNRAGESNFPVGAVLTHRGSSYALLVQRDEDGAVQNVCFFDSHGYRNAQGQGSDNAYIARFASIDHAAAFLAQKCASPRVDEPSLSPNEIADLQDALDQGVENQVDTSILLPAGQAVDLPIDDLP